MNRLKTEPTTEAVTPRPGCPPYTRVLVPLDGTPEAAVAIDVAASYAAAAGIPLETLTVARPAAGAELAHRVDEQLAAAGVVADRRIVEWVGPSASDYVARVLLDERGTDESTLVVIASEANRRGRAVAGSLVDRVLRVCGGPLLLVGPNCRPIDRGVADRRVLVPCDDPRLDASLVELVASWSNQFAISVELFHVDETATREPAGSNGAWMQAHRQLSTRQKLAGAIAARTNHSVAFTRSEHHDAAAAIVERSSAADVELIVMSSRRRRRLVQAAMGSVALEVTRQALCPVLVLRPDNVPRHEPAPDNAKSRAGQSPADQARGARRDGGLTGEYRLVLVGTSEEMTGLERLCAVFPNPAGDELLLPIEHDRPANEALLTAPELYLRDGDGTWAWTPLERRTLSRSEWAELEARTAAPLGYGMEVIRLGHPREVELDLRTFASAESAMRAAT